MTSVERSNAKVTDYVSGLIDAFDSGPLGRSDVVGVQASIARTWLGLANHPAETANALFSWGLNTMASLSRTSAVAAGQTPEPARAADKRFADPAWSANPAYFSLREQYENLRTVVDALFDAAGLAPSADRKSRFLAQIAVEAAAPTNSVLTNPVASRKAVETGGRSLVRGAENFLDDLAHNNGQPRQFDADAFQLGQDLAITPGKVVYRNDLMELLQYTPTTDTVYEIPLLFSPPWINKYYIMDLAPDRSLVQWAVDHGHTVFVISYRNPDQSMRNVRLDDYLIHGPRAAMDVVSDITGSEKVNLLGLCLGGTLTMSLLAFLDATGDDRINSATFLNTLIDFTDPGILGATTDPVTVTKLETVMQETGFLPALNMSRTFDLLRPNDLVFNYVVRNWLMGEDPPAFDILTWNADSTRMPAAMHSFYLRSCYLNNRLAQGTMELAGQPLDLNTVDQDLYFLAAEADHIAPWRSSYAGARLPKGNVRFVLSNAGHIAGIVNPPSPKSKHWARDDDDMPESADEWRAGAVLHEGTWWQDWATWIGERAGARRTPPALGSQAHPAQGDAPGSYVFEH